jgi:hypothetical protein
MKSSGSNDQSQYQDMQSTGAMSSSTTNMPIVPTNWLNTYNGLLSQNGNTPGQTAAYNYYTGQLTAPVDGPGGLLSNINRALDYNVTRPAIQVTQPTNVNAMNIAAPTVNAPSGASAMAPYSALYSSAVVDPTLANFDQNTANQLNALRASRDAGSAFGDRANLADSQFLNQSDLNRAQLQSNLLNAGFNNAANFGQADANRYLQAGTTNAANALTAGQVNAANSLNAQQFNNNLNSQNQQFNVNSSFNQVGQDLGALNQLGQNLVTQNSLNTNAANALASLGGANFGQMISALNSGVPTFGQQSNISGQQQGHNWGTGSSSSSGSSKGFGI